MALAASVKKSALRQQRKTQKKKLTSGIKQTCFKGNSNSEHRAADSAFLRYHLKRIPNVQKSCSGCLIEKYRFPGPSTSPHHSRRQCNMVPRVLQLKSSVRKTNSKRL